MDLNQAIDAHVSWKTKLATYLLHPNGTINGSKLALDDQCELGKWIHGDGGRLSNEPNFVHLAAAHARFHKEAAEIVRKADAGQQVMAEAALGAKSEYARASNEVVMLLMKLKRLAA